MQGIFAKLRYLASRLKRNPKRLLTLLTIFLTKGPRGVKERLAFVLSLGNIDEQYQFWLKKYQLTDQILAEQRERVKRFRYRPLISVIVPIYNTPEKFLTECIESVLTQTYDNWQLCLADDASTKQYIRKIIDRYAKQDPRIAIVYRKKNGHISAASNSALAIAKGEFIALLDHDDILWPHALYENVKLLQKHKDADFIYSDEDKLEEDGITHTGPFFKPNYSPDYLRSTNYITHFALLRRSIVTDVGNFRSGFEGAQDWDLFLRVSQVTNKIYHIPTILYSWRKSEHSTASEKYVGKVKRYAPRNQQKALLDDLKQRGYRGTVERSHLANAWRVRYAITGRPKVSIIIPTKNQYQLLSTCLQSIFEKSTYKNYDIVLVDTGSSDEDVLALYDSLRNNKRVTIASFPKTPFNFSAACNFGAKKSDGAYLLFLNNDTEVITPDWIEGMLELAQKPETGAVGALLLYPDDRIQHAGGILGVPGDEKGYGVASHAFLQLSKDIEHVNRWCIRNYSFVTAACLMVERKKFATVKGFDPSFQIAWNDVDFCLKLFKKHYYNVVTPYVVLKHYESASIGKPGEQKHRDVALFAKEILHFVEKWRDLRTNDPFYNPNFSLKTGNFDRLNI